MSDLVAVVASDADARRAAEEQLAAGGTAAEAVIAAWFAVAGASTWALFAPLTLATAGGGGGARFFDGRARQPGKGFERPSRYPSGKEPPPVSRAAVPGSIAALAVMSALSGSGRMPALAQAGIKLAKDAGAKERARLLARVADGANMALNERSFLGELASRALRVDGALIGAEDFEEIRPDAEEGSSLVLAGRTARVPSWSQSQSFAHLAPGRAARPLLLACDAWGGMAAFLVEPPPAGLPLYDGEVDLPLLAEPLTKGVPRCKPGAPLVSPAPLATIFDGDTPIGMVTTSARHLEEELLRDGQLLDDAAPTGWLPPKLASRGHPAHLYAVLRPKNANGRAFTRRLDAD